MVLELDVTAILVALIGAISAYLVGHRVGRKVHRTGDYVDKRKILYEGPPE